MRRWLWLALALLVLPAVPRPACATVGGDWLCEMLGYEPSTQRVYVHELDGTGGGTFGRVMYASCSRESAGVFRDLPLHPSKGEAGDPELLSRLAALRARLEPLRELSWPTLPFSAVVLQRDSIPSEFGQPIRLRVRAEFGPAVELTCWRSDAVTRPKVFELPDGAGWLWVIAFIGDPFESGYEVQVPVLVHTGTREAIPVAWGRAHD